MCATERWLREEQYATELVPLELITNLLRYSRVRRSVECVDLDGTRWIVRICLGVPSGTGHGSDG